MTLSIPLSVEEFMLRLEREDGLREELIEGELIVSPAAKVWHAAIVDRLRERLAKLKSEGFTVPPAFSCILGRSSMPGFAKRFFTWNTALKSGLSTAILKRSR